MTTSRIQFSWITSQRDFGEHAVSDAAQAAAIVAGRGEFEALCGARFLAASMSAAPRAECACCRAYLRARFELRDLDERMSARRPRRGLHHRRGRHAA